MTFTEPHNVTNVPLLTDWQPDTLHCREQEAPLAWSEGLHTAHGKAAFYEGLPPAPRVQLPGYDSGIMCMLIVMFLFVTTNFRHYSTFIKTFAHDLFSVRKRANVFDERNTMRETRVLISLVLLVCMCEGILIYSAISIPQPVTIPAFVSIGTLSIITLGYYLWQLAAYKTVGYVFAGTTKSGQWVKGFNASQCLLGITLFIPAMVTLFYPGFAGPITIIAITLYICARVIFIFKGFRIFYNKSFTLVYFILYLCALEIIPLIFLYKLSLFSLLIL